MSSSSKRLIHIRALLWLGLLGWAASAPAQQQNGQAPSAEEGRGRNREERPIRVHDPAIIKEGDTYYLFVTGRGVPGFKSQDLIHWESNGRVFDRNETPDWPGHVVERFRGDMWAPDIAKIGDRYCLYYSCSSFGSRNSAIGLVTNKTLDRNSPDYKWEDQGLVIQSNEKENNWNAIDANVVQDAEGQWWLNWGSWWGGLKMCALDAKTGKPPRNFPELHSLAKRPRGGIEAPFIVRRGDYYYLFVSFDHCCRGANSDYNIRVGRAKEVTGPYLDAEGVDMMDGGGTLVLEGYENVRGPGHNSILIEDGNYYLVHHYYDANLNGFSTLQVRLLSWDDAGWPVPGAPLGAEAAGADADESGAGADGAGESGNP